ncbi:acetyltransferase [Bifidobacterium eulemuris]|uniref:Acetyltransferase n=2 Tax=Bifidobacterium eulemuris TaxID=1765219 RepID=A0A261G3A9_9BIFI|nr:acetyltransferase [Bifidobacterium eulemuris]QOL33154.1 GNAT family N-acetyltransferase [Bifidobacterium eulemuris]
MPYQLHAPAGGVPVTLRPLTADDADEWNDVRWANDDWLKPWESGDPLHGPGLTYNQWMQRLRRNEQQGVGAVFAIEYQTRIVGQVSLGAICYGAMRTGVVGYWVDQRHAGRGIAPMAVGLLADWALTDFTGPALHRLEIAILPENERSQSVARKVGARHEGVRERYMYVNGQWRDHETYALLTEDAGDEGFAARLARRGANVPQ